MVGGNVLGVVLTFFNNKALEGEKIRVKYF